LHGAAGWRKKVHRIDARAIRTPMQFSHLHYLPLPVAFFSILVGIFVVVVLLLEFGALEYAYVRLGISPRMAMLLLFASLIGSYFNIPVAELPERHVVSGQEIAFFGMHYVIPVVVEWPGTIVAVNVGGALIPGAMSIWLIFKHRLWIRSLIAVACVAAVCHLLARPVPGLGVALPVFVPAITTAIVALVLSRRHAAPLAYIGGTLGTLIGADLLNLGRIQGLGAPVASIGGAGTFDGIFLTGIVAVLLASLTMGPNRNSRITGLPSNGGSS
jgi:uncharacterized membrane protein